MNRTTWLAAGIAACLGATPAFAQQADEHAGHHQTPPTPTSTDKAKEAQTPSKQADMDHTTMDHGQMQDMDHAKMGHADDGELPAAADPREPIPVPTPPTAPPHSRRSTIITSTAPASRTTA